MNKTIDTTTAATVTADAVTARKTAKQHPIVVNPFDKQFIQDLKEEFGLKNDMEAVAVLLKVATDYRFDKDGIDALTGRRDTVWEKIGNASFLTLNEKRTALGYAPVAGADSLPVGGK